MTVYKTTSKGVFELTGKDLEEWNILNENAEANSIFAKAAESRYFRNILLDKSDWSQMPDISLTESKKELWAQYRQALRDIPQQAGFPNEVTWPVEP